MVIRDDGFNFIFVKVFFDQKILFGVKGRKKGRDVEFVMAIAKQGLRIWDWFVCSGVGVVKFSKRNGFYSGVWVTNVENS
jgi:hypothetical protein